MKKQHKWFRRERYKKKLERDIDKHKTYYSNVYFITQEPDPRYLRENWNHRASWLLDDTKKFDYLTAKRPGRDYYIYYDRPEVEYTILYYHKKSGRSKAQKFLKKYTNHRVRQAFKQKGDIYQHNEYRRTTELWWILD